ncbi:MAG: AMP-binding protein [Candidatus Omnitrophica bacterium]|nr:AMP-binding protein [Candidatus Omnitrophota bacterium]
MNNNIFTEFKRVVNANQSKPAALFKQGQEYLSLSYNELFSRSIKLGNFLFSKGIKAGDKAAILLPNQPDWPISFMAIQYLGAIAVPLDARMSAQDIKQLLSHSQSKILITSEKNYTNIRESLADLKNLLVLQIDSGAARKEINSAEDKDKEPAADFTSYMPAAMFYTSGTTSSPKAVVLSHANILANLASMHKLNIARSDDVVISFLPLFHTYSFMATCLLPLSLGARISYPSGLSSEGLLECIKNTGVSILVGVPEVFAIFHKSIKRKIQTLPFFVRIILGVLSEICWVIRKLTRINLSKLLFFKIHEVFGKDFRFMITGGARLEPKVITDLSKWGFTVLEGYGLTETSPVATFNRPENPKIGSVGMAIPDVQVKVASPNMRGIGEVAIKGQNVMLGYYKTPGEIENPARDGWFFTGDLGYFDKRGFLYLAGRKDEMIVLSSGKKVLPEEIERYYNASPYIKEICVFLPEAKDEEGEARKLMAVVVPDEDYFRKSGKFNIEEQIKWELDNISHRLSTYQRIHGFLISKEKLPRTLLGKIMRHRINAFYLAQLSEVSKKKEEVSGDDVSLLADESIQKIFEYLSGHLNKKVNLDDHLELDLGIDSLGRIELFLELQSAFNIDVPETVAMELFYSSTVRELLLKVRPYLGQGLSAAGGQVLAWSKVMQEDPSEKTLQTVRMQPTRMDKTCAYLFMGAMRVFFKLFFRLKVKGEKYPDKGPYIIIANHSSYLDPLAVICSLPVKTFLSTYFVGFKQILFNPLLKGTVKTARFVPIDMSFDSKNAMQTCAYLVRHSKIICFFPEGGRSPEGKIVKFKGGIGILAKELNVTLVPVYIKGAFEAWSRHKMLPSPSKIEVTVGKSFTCADLPVKTEEEYDAVAEELRQWLIELSRRVC